MARRTVEFDALPEALRSPTLGAQIAARLDSDALALDQGSNEFGRSSDPIADAQAQAYRLTADEFRKWHASGVAS